jgi:hypothetical protein
LRWLRLLPRLSLLTAFTAIALPVAFLSGVGQQASDNALGPDYVELLQAVRSAGMFRVAWAMDAAVWLMLGGILIAVAGILGRQTPIRARFIAICGMTQQFGALGSLLRLDGISDIATRYLPASPDQQAALLGSYLDLWRVINSSNHLAVLLQGMGFLLVAWGLYSLRGFPRWLAAWFALPGALGIAQFGLFVTGADYLFALNVLGLVAGNIALNLAIAVALWRPPKLLIAGLTSMQENGKETNGRD